MGSDGYSMIDMHFGAGGGMAVCGPTRFKPRLGVGYNE